MTVLSTSERSGRRYGARGVRWIASLRRVRETIAKNGPEGVKGVIAGLIALGIRDIELLQDEVSDILGYDAGNIVAAYVEEETVHEGVGLWETILDGSLTLT